ncbi:unnamed protein product [Euphydryas editha]|uniref:Transposase n=1 Tax=Euphydryas editha TaxID=104508 RepID=A0AAU9VAF8_EUPED|nr:unnamed protein product [Euphydryas editha]
MRDRRELHYVSTVHRVIWKKKLEYFFKKLNWIKDHSSRSRRTNTRELLKLPKHKTARFSEDVLSLLHRAFGMTLPLLLEVNPASNPSKKNKKALIRRERYSKFKAFIL